MEQKGTLTRDRVLSVELRSVRQKARRDRSNGFNSRVCDAE
jgi:hypothetical protein